MILPTLRDQETYLCARYGEQVKGQFLQYEALQHANCERKGNYWLLASSHIQHHLHQFTICEHYRMGPSLVVESSVQFKEKPYSEVHQPQSLCLRVFAQHSSWTFSKVFLRGAPNLQHRQAEKVKYLRRKQVRKAET
jgi:hypothetical protein